MPIAPDWFRRSLNLLDSDLRVRWGQSVGKWVIEQKSVVLPSEIFYLKKREARLRSWVANPKVGESQRTTVKNHDTWADLAERLESALAGYRIICYPGKLDQETYNTVCAGSHAKYGGYSSFFDKLEADEEREFAVLETHQTKKNENTATEVYDMVDFVGRKRQALLQNGHRDFGLLVHGKPSGSESLIKYTDA